MKNYFRTLARYNQWANNRLFETCKQMPDTVYHQNRNAFFSTIHGTLNHILQVDQLWFKRVEGVATGNVQLDQILFEDLASLAKARTDEDQAIIDRMNKIDDSSYSKNIYYRNTKGEAKSMSLHFILAHVFNHQTHHRGQVHNMLTQAGLDAPSIDLVYYLPEEKV